MSALFIITVALLAAIAYTIYHKQRHQAGTDYELPPHAPPRGLFDESHNGESRAQLAATDPGPAPAGERAALLGRAAAGDFDALADAAALRGGSYYAGALAELLKWAEPSDERLDTLARVVATAGAGSPPIESLRGSVGLSQAYGRLWERAPDGASTARALHLAALSDDADEFGRVVEAAARLWRAGRLGELSAGGLCSLVEGEFWLLDSAARASGAGFVAKQMIAALRAELRPDAAAGGGA